MKKEAQRTLQAMREGWNRFFFEEDARGRIALFRLIFGITLFIAYSVRSIDSELFFGQSGMLDIEAMNESFPLELARLVPKRRRGLDSYRRFPDFAPDDGFWRVPASIGFCGLFAPYLFHASKHGHRVRLGYDFGFFPALPFDREYTIER
jgi:hypothetical protein